jgi:alkylglycerol monooxygenase
VTPAVGVLLALAALAAVANWAAIWVGSVRLERVAKPAALLALLLAAILWPIAPGASGVVRACLVVALAASLAGDVLLLPPGRFVPGLVAFLVAQLAYLAAFVQLPGGSFGLVLGIALAFGMVLTVGYQIVEGARTHRLEAAVAVYLAAICGMAITATRTGIPLAIAGAWLFVASDSILGWDRFAARPAATEREARSRHLAVMVTYHLGQGLLVLALAA